jgi:hypothetical protein
MGSKSLLRQLLAFLFLSGWVVVVSDSAARTGDLNKDPVDLVRVFVSLDNKGVRLDSMSWETLKPYVNWRDEPAWGHMVVIEGYEVVDDTKRWEIVSNTEVVIPVEYRTLGAVYWNTAGFLPDKQIEQVGFRVKAVNSRWKIVEPILPPHVSQKRLINHVREAILEEPDLTRRRTLETLRDELRKAR